MTEKATLHVCYIVSTYYLPPQKKLPIPTAGSKPNLICCSLGLPDPSP